MESLLQDIRYGVRSLAKSTRFSIAAVLTLALGMGTSTAMFSVMYAVLLKAWPYPDPGRLLLVTQHQADGNTNLFSTQDFLDWKQQGGLLTRMGAHVSWAFNLAGGGVAAERVAGGKASFDLLPTLGVQPMLGRFFSESEDVAGAGNYVILSAALWRTRYGADREIIGKPIPLDGTPYTVVGVMPAGFDIFDGKELLWTPLQLHAGNGVGASRNIHWINGVIRLPDGATLQQVQNQLNAIADRLHRENPTSTVGYGVIFLTLKDAFTSSVRPALLMLMGCVGFVLLIACVNVANLLLARGAVRQREIAVRTALGASPLRIMRQLLTESAVLACAGGFAGIGIAVLLLRGVLALHPPAVPRIDAIGIDGAVLGFSFALCVLVGILFGIMPAFESTRVDVSEALRKWGTNTIRGFGLQRSILVVTETALACMLLIGTGLALKSLWSLKSVQLGFDPQHVVIFRIAAPAQLTGAKISDFYRDVAERVRALPGVESAAVARDFPLGGVDPSMPIETEGKAPPPVQGEIATRFRAVGDDYFRTLATPVLQGRAFSASDTAGSMPVAIVSESLARKYWPGESAVGKRIKPRFAGSSWCQVVGVVADVRHWGGDVTIEPTAYYPYTQAPDSIRSLLEANMGIAVRSRLSQRDLIQPIKVAAGSVNADLPVFGLKTMESMVADTDSLRNFDLMLLGVFSLLALTLAAVGVHAVMAYSVSQRTREMGIRMALGARAGDVLRLILQQGARLAIVGAVIGVVAAMVLRKVMASFLYGLSANDPIVMPAVGCFMILVVVLACWMPARRATKVDPTVALRYE